MRFLGYTLANEAETPTEPPRPELYEEMGAFVEEAVNAGVIVATGGIAPTAQGAKVSLQDGEFTVVDGPSLGHRGEPGAGVERGAVARPLAEGVDQGVLGQVFGQSDVAHKGGHGGDDPGKLHPEDRLDAGGRIGGRHATDSTIRPCSRCRRLR